MYGDIESEKRKIHHCKNLILLKYVDINSTLISRMFSSGEKIINFLLVTNMMTVKLKHCT